MPRMMERVTFYVCVLVVVTGALLCMVPGVTLAQETPLATGDGAGESNIPIVMHQARSIEWQSNQRRMVASGDVDVEYGQYRIRADTVTYSDTSRRVTARGRVHVQSPFSDSIRGTFFSFKAGSNEISMRRSDVDLGRWRARARRVDGDADTEIVMTDGSFTNCNLKTPHYDVKATSIYVYPGERIVAYNAMPRIMEVPFFYWPYLTIDLEEGLSRWEFEPGVSDRNGAKLGVTYHYLMEKDQYPVTGSLYTDLNQTTRPGLGLDVEYDSGPGDIYMFYFQSNRHPLVSDTDGNKVRTDERERLYRFRSDVDMPIGDSRWDVRGNVDWSSDQRLENVEFNSFTIGQPSRRTLDGAVTWRGDNAYFSVRARKEERVVSENGREQFIEDESLLPRIRFSRYSRPVSWLSDDLYYRLSADATRRSGRDTAPFLWDSQIRQSLSRTFSIVPGLSQTWEGGYRHQFDEVDRNDETEFESTGSGLFSLENTIRPSSEVSFSLEYDVEKRFSNTDSVPLRLNSQDLGYEEDGFRQHEVGLNSSWNMGQLYAFLETGYDLRSLGGGELESDSRVISPLLNLSSQLTTTLGWTQFARYDWARDELNQFNTSFTYEPTRRFLTSFGWNFNRGDDRDFSDLRNQILWRFPDHNLTVRSDLIYDTKRDTLDETQLMISKQLHMWDLKVFYRDIRNNDQEITFTINLLDYPPAESGSRENRGSSAPRFGEEDWRTQ